MIKLYIMINKNSFYLQHENCNQSSDDDDDDDDEVVVVVGSGFVLLLVSLEQ